jgi:hypothetical protein
LTEGRLLIPQLRLSLGLWQGNFENIERLWLRWFTASGELILTPDEEAAAAQQRAESAEQRADRLAARLRELGVNPDEWSKCDRKVSHQGSCTFTIPHTLIAQKDPSKD